MLIFLEFTENCTFSFHMFVKIHIISIETSTFYQNIPIPKKFTQTNPYLILIHTCFYLLVKKMRSLNVCSAILALVFLVSIELNEANRILMEEEAEEHNNSEWQMMVMKEEEEYICLISHTSFFS